MVLRHFFRNYASITAARQLKPSIFTGKADFYETLYFLDDILLKTRDLKSSPTQSIEFNWLNREKLQNKLGFEMSLLEYRQIRQRLGKIENAATFSSHILEFLRVFGDPVEQEDQEDVVEARKIGQKNNSLGYIDELGRAVAVGRRKSSSAKVMLVPGSGEFMVNGRALVDYFPRFRDIYSVAKPFQVTSQFGKFNVWSLVKSGGHTGKQTRANILTLNLFTLFRSIWCYRFGSG